MYCRTMAETDFFGILEELGSDLAKGSVSCEKFFGFFENFVCICGKMGYNRMYENL